MLPLPSISQSAKLADNVNIYPPPASIPLLGKEVPVRVSLLSSSSNPFNQAKAKQTVPCCPDIDTVAHQFRCSLQHQRMLGIVYRPRLEATQKALSKQQTAIHRCYAALNVFNHFVTDLQRPNAEGF